MKNDYVTNFSYLKIPIRPRYPKCISKFISYFMKHGLIPFVKILGPLLGFRYPKNGVKRLPECMIKLKDGTRLATDIYIPKKVYKKNSKCATILVRLPYWKESLRILGYAYAAYGFVAILQDIRGTGHSDGFNYYLFTEREDGMETLEWISKQYWYNGKIGMTGGSYFGMTQLALSWDNDYLSCIIPAVTSTLNLWKNNGGLDIHALTTSIYRIMVNIVSNYDLPDVSIMTTLMKERYLNPRYALYNDPIRPKTRLQLSSLKGKSIEDVKKLLTGYYNVKNFDPTKRNYRIYFKFLNDFLITKGLDKDAKKMSGFLDMDASKFSQPALFLAGWQDMFLEKQLEDFSEIQANATGDAKKYSKLVIGSWAHGAVGHPESKYKNAGIARFYKEVLNIDWFNYWLKGKKHAYQDIDNPPIKYWVMGKNIWKYTEIWPPKNIVYKDLYIHSQGRANSIKGNGVLNYNLPDNEPTDHYIFDPMDPVITRGGRNLDLLKGAQDQKDAERRTDVLVYSTDPLVDGIEVTGPVKMILYACSSVTDTDFIVKLVDVYPRGKAINILDAGIRARFRNGEDNPSLIEPNKIYQYQIDLGNTSNYFRKGHRIRIEISSSNFPRFDINSNLGGENKSQAYILAEQTIFHNIKYPSHLLIPIFNDSSKKS